MQTGEYIVDRLMPDMIRLACQRQGIDCESMSEDWVLRLTHGEDIRWVLGYKFDLNTAAASALAQDKVAMHVVLKQAGIASVEHALARSVPHQPIERSKLQAFSGAPLVIKPLDGSGGRGVSLAPTLDDAIRHITDAPEPAWAISPHYDLEQEFRLIMLRGQTLLAYEKTQPVEQHGLKFFNLSKGAIAADIADPDLTEKLEQIACTVCREASLQLAAVDIVRTATGELLVLEVNDGFMMENYARQSNEYKNRATQLYDTIVAKMFA